MECCVEFIQLVSSEANEITDRDGKRSIGPEQILAALKQLGILNHAQSQGFETYVEPLEVAQAEAKAAQQAKPKLRKKLEDSGLSQAELLRQQEVDLVLTSRNFSQNQGQLLSIPRMVPSTMPICSLKQRT